MRTIIFGAAALSIALAGCNTTKPLTPNQQAVVTIAYDSVCPVIGMKALAAQVAGASQTTKAAYDAAMSLCASGAPTSASEGGYDLAQAFVVLLPYLLHHGLQPQTATAMAHEYLRADHPKMDAATRAALQRFVETGAVQ